MTYICSRCGATHDLPFSFAFEAPASWYGLAEGERPRRALLDEEVCAIDQQYVFIRGRICSPVHESPDPFEWVV